jgi:hypothetical protein
MRKPLGFEDNRLRRIERLHFGKAGALMDAFMMILGIAFLVLVIAGGAFGVDSRDGMRDDHQRSAQGI